MRNILVAVDFSPITERVVKRASELARGLDCHVWLIHAAAPDPDFVGYEAGPVGVRDQVAEELRHEHRELQAHADALRESGLEATALLVQGPTVEMILKEADRLDADLILIGSHGHGAVFRLLLGSISEGVLRRTKIPVMIIPSNGQAPS
jgi:nucleotide-binding universal stress UspA family protein